MILCISAVRVCNGDGQAYLTGGKEGIMPVVIFLFHLD